MRELRGSYWGSYGAVEAALRDAAAEDGADGLVGPCWPLREPLVRRRAKEVAKEEAAPWAGPVGLKRARRRDREPPREDPGPLDTSEDTVSVRSSLW